MPAVKVAHPKPSAQRRAKAYLVDAAGRNRVELSWAPQGTTLDGNAADIAVIARPGRKPITRRNADGLLTLTFTASMGYVDIERSVEPALARLRALAASGDRVRFSYGADAAAAGWWLISGLSITSTARQEGSNAITRADVDVTLTEFVSGDVRVGKTATAGGGRAWNAASWGGSFGSFTGGGGGKKPKGPSTYRVKHGDTLFAIAHRVYGDGSSWPVIARANGIKDPRQLKVGTKLKIPAQGKK